jgi:hypothetical protein
VHLRARLGAPYTVVCPSAGDWRRVAESECAVAYVQCELLSCLNDWLHLNMSVDRVPWSAQKNDFDPDSGLAGSSHTGRCF